MKKLVLYVIGIVVVGVFTMPLVVKNQINQQIDDEKQMLGVNGLELSIKKDEGYFSSYREFELKIINGKKFRDFVLKRFAQKNPNYKGLTELMQKRTNHDIRPALDGTTFSGNIKNSNMYIANPIIKISLTKFSDEIMTSLDGNKEASKLSNSILNEKLFTFFITLDKNQKVSKIVMQDIDKDIDIDGDTINVKLKNHKFDIDAKEGLKGKYTLGEQSLKSEKFFLSTKGIEYKFDYLTQFDNTGSLHIDSFKFKESKDAIKVENMNISNSIKTVKNTLDADIKYSVKDIYFKNYSQEELNNFVFDITVLGVDKDGSIKGTRAYSVLAFNPAADSIKNFTDALQVVLNRGFKANIKTSLSGLSFQNMAFGKSDFTLNLNIDKNSYTLNSPDIGNAFLVNGKLTLDEKNIQNIIKLDKNLEKFVKLGKKDGSKVVFDYEFKQSVLLINGNKI
jgi:hypothetical protein